MDNLFYNRVLLYISGRQSYARIFHKMASNPTSLHQSDFVKELALYLNEYDRTTTLIFVYDLLNVHSIKI